MFVKFLLNDFYIKLICAKILQRNINKHMDYRTLLNEQQYKAVSTDSQYVRVVAGAGSGKTRTLTYRISYLIGEKGFCPSSILLRIVGPIDLNNCQDFINSSFLLLSIKITSFKLLLKPTNKISILYLLIVGRLSKMVLGCVNMCYGLIR